MRTHLIALALTIPLLAAAATAVGAELTVFVTGSMADPLEQAATSKTARSYAARAWPWRARCSASSCGRAAHHEDTARGKAQLKPMAYLVGEAVANGDAELGLSFMSEFVANLALTVVPFPDALQKPQLYTAGVFAGSAHEAVARELIAFLTSAGARVKLSAAGVVPAAGVQ